MTPIHLFVINNKGFAGDVSVAVTAGNIAAIKDYFQFDVSARILFNVTSEDQEVKFLDRFLTADFILTINTRGGVDDDALTFGSSCAPPIEDRKTRFGFLQTFGLFRLK